MPTPIKMLLLGSLHAVVQAHALAQTPPNPHRHPAQATAVTGPPSPTAPAQHRRQTREWTRYPVIEPVMRGGERNRNSMVLTARNIDAPSLEVLAPDQSVADARRQVRLSPQGAAVSMLQGVGNYYWISAQEEKEGRVSVASTAVHFSEDGPAPTRLLHARKTALEIIPQPLPREHGSYRESEKWAFLLRYNGRPLAGATLNMETEFGTRTTFTSDDDGEVTVLFPRDFKPVPPGREAGEHGGRQRGRFVLVAEHEADGKQYVTAFNHTYSADPDRGRSLAWGAVFGMLGMVAAAPLLRRRVSKEGQGGTHA